MDVDRERVDAINRGESHIPDVPSTTVARLVSDGLGPSDGRLSATTDYDALGSVDAVIICVPTPLSKTRDPDVSHIVAAADEIAGRLHPGVLVVLESTTYPGATEELIPAAPQGIFRRSLSDWEGLLPRLFSGEDRSGQDRLDDLQHPKGDWRIYAGLW